MLQTLRVGIQYVHDFRSHSFWAEPTCDQAEIRYMYLIKVLPMHAYASFECSGSSNMLPLHKFSMFDLYDLAWKSRQLKKLGMNSYGTGHMDLSERRKMKSRCWWAEYGDVKYIGKIFLSCSLAYVNYENIMFVSQRKSRHISYAILSGGPKKNVPNFDASYLSYHMVHTANTLGSWWFPSFTHKYAKVGRDRFSNA
jgi:hypothetical protein